ncbi:hypothetical protein NE865_02320 [Phthorimaea operculella]|nr:hypothetical protein NE865_02320 [Phthorimaea operculella]
MAKFIKSIFTTEKKKPSSEEDANCDFTPPLDQRRKLSISRSGRMKQANKKRFELSPDLYGEETIQYEKPKNKEYHVNKVIDIDPNRQPSLDRQSKEEKIEEHKRESANNRSGEKSPEEEIESAFEIIDKVS